MGTVLRRHLRDGLAVAVTLLVAAGISIAVNRNNTPAPSPPSAKQACSDWASLKSDLTAGILTDAEMRARAQRIYDEVQASSARYATILASQQVLAAITHGDRAAIGPAMTDLDTECVYVSTQP